MEIVNEIFNQLAFNIFILWHWILQNVVTKLFFLLSTGSHRVSCQMFLSFCLYKEFNYCSQSKENTDCAQAGSEVEHMCDISS